MSCQSCNSWSTLPAKPVVFGFAARIRVQKKDMPGETTVIHVWHGLRDAIAKNLDGLGGRARSQPGRSERGVPPLERLLFTALCTRAPWFEVVNGYPLT